MTVLAFGFVSPWLLWGIALGAVPILIQWLYRRNYTERVWAAMRFLRAATKSRSRRLRFESLLLLLIRTLILVLATLALAEPYLESAGWLPHAESNLHRLIVIDTSLSMQYESDGRQVSEQARVAARRLLADARTGDSFQIVTIDRHATALISRPSHDATEVLAEIDQLAATEEFGDVPRSLEVARRLLAEAPGSSRAAVTIISDFQRSNWWPDEPTDRRRILQGLRELAKAAELSLVRVGQENSANAAVGEVSIEPPLATTGTSVQIDAAVHRNGTAADRSIPVELVEKDRVRQTQAVELSSSGAGNATFTSRWHDAERHGLEVRLHPDGLEADDHRWLTLDVRDGLDVLLVNGRQSAESLGRATDFVELALAPATSEASPGRSGQMNYRPFVVSEAELARTSLAEFDCVVLCDIPFLSDGEASRLRTFVQGGGGLIIALGDQVQPAAYNKWLHGDGAGLMPIDLMQIVAADDDSGSPFHFAQPQRAHPIVEPFLGNPHAGLTTANIYRYFATSPHSRPPSGALRPAGESGQSVAAFVDAGSAVRLAVTFDNGDPAILAHEYGAGRVLLVTTSLDDRWGSWALWPSFLPMVHRMIEYASGGASSRTYLVGETLQARYPLQTLGLSATVQRPDGRRSPARSTSTDGATQVTFADTTRSGLYRLILGPPLNVAELIAVNVDIRESDLAVLREAEMSGLLLGGIDARLITGAEQLTRHAAAATPSSPLVRWLLLAVLVLLLVEQTMAWNASYGLMLLGAAPLAVCGFVFAPLVTLVMVAAVPIIVVALRRWAPAQPLRRLFPPKRSR